MSGGDPHIHVKSNPKDEPVVRDMIASTFGLASNLPSVVTTGCGLRVPYAMTSPRPESVTCLPCREHARQHHLRSADMFDRWSSMPTTGLSGARIRRTADRLRDLAKRFSTEDG